MVDLDKSAGDGVVSGSTSQTGLIATLTGGFCRSGDGRGGGLAFALRSVARDISTAATEPAGAAAIIALARESALRLSGAVDIAEAPHFVRDRLDAELDRLRRTSGATAIGYEGEAHLVKSNTPVFNYPLNGRHVIERGGTCSSLFDAGLAVFEDSADSPSRAQWARLYTLRQAIEVLKEHSRVVHSEAADAGAVEVRHG